jgi:hypothetical protein
MKACLGEADMKKISIFNEQVNGIVKQTTGKKASSVYFTLSSSSGNALKALFMGSAPATHVSITEAVDYDLHKAMNGGYVVASFGYAPVKIIMSGVDIYADAANCVRYNSDIKGWWDRYNLHAAPDERVELGIYSRDGTAVYSCIVINIVREANGSTGNYGAYQITLIGVRK